MLPPQENIIKLETPDERAISKSEAKPEAEAVERGVMGAVFAVVKSQKQKQLEAQGCVFRGQELLDNHEIDPMKECYCGRPKKY